MRTDKNRIKSICSQNKIQIVNPALNQSQRHAIKLILRDDGGIAAGTGYLPVLTEQTMAWASGKENSAGAAPPGKARLLAHVRPPRSNPQLGRCAANATPATRAIHTAFTRTKPTNGIIRICRRLIHSFIQSLSANSPPVQPRPTLPNPAGPAASRRRTVAALTESAPRLRARPLGPSKRPI